MRKPWTAVRRHQLAGFTTEPERLPWATFRTLAEAWAWCETMSAGERTEGLTRIYWPVLNRRGVLRCGR